MLGKGGIVKDPAAHRFAIERVMTCAVESGLSVMGLIASPIKGGDGNREFLIHLKKRDGASNTVDINTVRRVTGG